MKIKTFLTTLLILASLGLSAQNNTEGEAFQLTKQGAHYVFTASINGIAFPDAVVVITQNLPLFTAPGDIGLKFFERAHAIFDFDQSVVFMKGK